MDRAGIAMLSVVLMSTMLFSGRDVYAQEAPAPGPASTDCLTVLVGLSDCLSYVTEGSNLTKPDKPCCPELAGLVESDPICLCYLLGNSSSSMGFQIDVSRALKLPSLCKVDTPPASTCSIFGIPVGAPSASEAPANSPAGSELAPGLAPGPSTLPGSNNINGASRSADSVMAFLLGLVIACLPSFF